jgi:hypothetical protein
VAVVRILDRQRVQAELFLHFVQFGEVCIL